ncbi:SH3 domain-containing protein [Crocosphaera sp.]|uniref:SH3 domain-containing protein n=1 Tax=Crocosphaera sp. TaxID=2729996 RepID=UPI00263336B5|nr:SH3 domain-containing protein [Crocosphaera sp.]MDJ0582315.1 SH3 domain-containing protein [Crocosphaera sp.]
MINRTKLAIISLSLLLSNGFSVLESQKLTAQPINQAVVFDPPSNVRMSPNGRIICSVNRVIPINIYGSENGWYLTDACGQLGYIHRSQIRLQSNQPNPSNATFCEVINIQRGQLALRFNPNGESRAGLNNGNIVRFISQQNIWYKVKVVQGPNSQVNGLEGWVNSNYLSCNNSSY